MPLKVIGAGLGRTGTLSLKLALEQLGLGRCYHMMEVFKNPDAPQQWLDAAEGRPVDWELVFDGYGASVDWPGAEFYAEHARLYPEAKVILSVRDADKWFDSTQATIFANPTYDGMPPVWAAMARALIGGKFDQRLSERQHCIDIYNRHNDEVRRTIPAERLLEFEAKQGWGPLCAFLGLPVPATPYPSVNSTEEFQGHVRELAKAT
ncbi:MAG: hypothetical protein JWP35_3864 [Caulobacter sp.]|nr:hypothetical protein [Caulobacter sp.]